jgi:hypothetical protein
VVRQQLIAEVLGSKAPPDDAGHDSPQHGQQRRRDRSLPPGHRVAQESAPTGLRDHPVQSDLNRLHEPHRQQAPPLHAMQVVGGNRADPKRCRQNPGRRDGILNRVIDAHPEGRRHGMCGVTDAQQPGHPPPIEPVHLHREKLHLVPVGEGTGDRGEERRCPEQTRTELLEARRLDLGEAPLGNQHARLVVVAAGNRDDH